MSEIRYKYKIGARLPIVGIILFSVLANYTFEEASNGTKVLSISGLFTLTPEISSIFFWCLFICMVLIALLSMFRLIASFRKSEDIVVGDSKIRMPKNEYSSKVVEISYTDISNFSLQSLRKIRVAVIEHTGGRAGVTEGVFESGKLFDEFVTVILTKLEANK